MKLVFQPSHEELKLVGGKTECRQMAPTKKKRNKETKAGENPNVFLFLGGNLMVFVLYIDYYVMFNKGL